MSAGTATARREVPPTCLAISASRPSRSAHHVHDLRHTGNTHAAESGASLAELMNRMWHSSTRAAQVYLHARRERDREIASSLGRMAE